MSILLPKSLSRMALMRLFVPIKKFKKKMPREEIGEQRKKNREIKDSACHAIAREYPRERREKRLACIFNKPHKRRVPVRTEEPQYKIHPQKELHGSKKQCQEPPQHISHKTDSKKRRPLSKEYPYFSDPRLDLSPVTRFCQMTDRIGSPTKKESWSGSRTYS